MTFDCFSLRPSIREGIAAAGFTSPTPIQEQAMPPALEGRDILGLAQTGTGKTAAFALPLLERLAAGPRGHLRALIVAPTRELAEQINDEIISLGRKTGLRSITVYGGVGKSPQINKLRRGAEIVVACPGRLLDLMNDRHANLSRLEILVLDEADRMFDMGFLPDIRRILSQAPPKRQTMLFSATMPTDIRKLADEALNSPKVVKIGLAMPAETVSHSLYPVPGHLKTSLLKHVLGITRTGSVLVFTRTKHRAKRLAQQLERAGHKATSLQGNLSQNRRQEALSGFKAGRYDIMVATDIAARGIDVSSVTHVINLDVPDTADAYTHRIGRTGRAARTGDALTFVTPEDTSDVRDIERAIGEKIARVVLDDFDYNAPKPIGSNDNHRPPRPPRAKAGAGRPGRSRRGSNGGGSSRSNGGNGNGGGSSRSNESSGGGGQRRSQPSGGSGGGQRRSQPSSAGGGQRRSQPSSGRRRASR
ncbi:DEAD/DEAH box helicase [Desulfovibrio ferrophilus]|uniref:ATP-dependent RNA helicase RhlE n=1 Tax=Desulfovibrio ferrophilus TaxID=241368 RepID=A0A2Z6B332_9BACT|nr:DEAD/DEAH box helicase [Desulfovibrio ferrophilus]BBD09855.1 ATP-dependent RNA helicase RhlE [Desulfovibrio ferrophilus]